MNGMQYLQPKFSAPAGPKNTSELRWDYSILTKKEFLKKWSRFTDDPQGLYDEIARIS